MRLAALAATLVFALVAAAAPALASEEHPTQKELEAELVCPACHTTLDLSDAPVAQEMKLHIRRWIAAGWTKSQIEDALVDQFGEGVIGVPRKHGFDLLAWVLPLGGIVAGAAALAAAAWYWSRGRSGEAASDGSSPGAAGAVAGPRLDPALERRVDEELARFDA
jgi:cytochrome c-type biogenesis protein CcmH/NrfF